MFALASDVIRVNSQVFGTQTGAEVVALSGGGFVVVWTDQQGALDQSRNVMFQRYDANGVAVGNNTAVAVTASGGERLTDVLALPGGGFAVAWTSTAPNPSTYGQSQASSVGVVRVFDASGAPLSSDSLVHSTTGATYSINSVELVATTGGFRAVFITQEGSEAKLRGKDFTNDGLSQTAYDFGTTQVPARTVVEAVAYGQDQLIFASGSTSNSTGSYLLSTFDRNSTHVGNEENDIVLLQNGLLVAGEGYRFFSTGGSRRVDDFFLYTSPVGYDGDDGALLALTEGQYLQAYLTAGGAAVTLRWVDVMSSRVIDTIEVDPRGRFDATQQIDATRLADGRVVLAWSRPGQFAHDIFFRIVALDRTPGTPGNDLLTGTGTAELLVGLGGDDTLAGGGGADTLNGGAGFDLVRYGAATASLVLDVAQPMFNTGEAAGQTFIEIEAFEGSNFADTMRGSDAAESISGGGGDDQLFGRLGADTLNGGSGVDRVSYATATGAVTVDLLRPQGNAGAAAGQTLISIEVLEGTAQGDRLYGSNGNDWLLGAAGNDLLRGRSGADTLDGGAGDDTLDGTGGLSVSLIGGAGTDRLLGGRAADNLRGDVGDDLLDGGQGADLLEGGEGDDRLHGRDGGDTLFGGLGDDTLSGYGDADFADGEEGDDTLYGGPGDDTLNGGDGDDSLAGGDGEDVIDLGQGDDQVALGGDGDDDILGSGSADRLFGDDGDDEIDADAGDDFIRAGAGDDLVLGSAGDDRIYGETGADTLDGGVGDDWFFDVDGGADFFGGAGNDTVSFEATSAISAGATAWLDNHIAGSGLAAGSRFFGIEALSGSPLADALHGSRRDDDLEGNAGDDMLAGDSGDDHLAGGAGNDVLDVGDGVDGVFFEHRSDGVDTILDFALDDYLVFARAGFNAIAANGFFATSNALTVTSAAVPKLIFDNAGEGAGSLYFDANAADVGGRILIARFYQTETTDLPFTALQSSDVVFY